MKKINNLSLPSTNFGTGKQKPIMAADEEIKENPPSRSAKIRIARCIGNKSRIRVYLIGSLGNEFKISESKN